MAFFSGETSVFAPTSEFVSFGTAPAVGSLFKYEVVLSPTTSWPLDFRMEYSIVGETTRFTYLSSASRTGVSSGIRGTTTERGHTFRFLAKQSSSHTSSFVGTIKVNWLALDV